MNLINILPKKLRSVPLGGALLVGWITFVVWVLVVNPLSLDIVHEGRYVHWILGFPFLISGEVINGLCGYPGNFDFDQESSTGHLIGLFASLLFNMAFVWAFLTVLSTALSLLIKCIRRMRHGPA